MWPHFRRPPRRHLQHEPRKIVSIETCTMCLQKHPKIYAHSLHCNLLQSSVVIGKPELKSGRLHKAVMHDAKSPSPSRLFTEALVQSSMLNQEKERCLKCHTMVYDCRWAWASYYNKAKEVWRKGLATREIDRLAGKH